jgi:predicted RNase H-like nuclease
MDQSDGIAGIDGCKAGWIVATARAVIVLPRLPVDLFDLMGIDIPIGLLDESRRTCDLAARRFLGRAGSSVFPSPPRAALSCTDYQSALRAARTATGRGISKQTFNIMPKIAEVDRLIDEVKQDSIIEVHPECTFKTLNEDEPLPSKKTKEGLLLRRRLLGEHFDVPSHAPTGASMNDLLDAYAVLWSAHRFHRGQHRVFGDGEVDSRGLITRIVC